MYSPKDLDTPVTMYETCVRLKGFPTCAPQVGLKIDPGTTRTEEYNLVRAKGLIEHPEASKAWFALWRRPTITIRPCNVDCKSWLSFGSWRRCSSLATFVRSLSATCNHQNFTSLTSERSSRKRPGKKGLTIEAAGFIIRVKAT